MQDGGGDEMGLAEAKTFRKTARCGKRVAGELGTGEASSEKGQPVGEFGEGVDITDSPVVAPEKKSREDTRQLMRGKGKTVADGHPQEEEHRDEPVGAESNGQGLPGAV